MTRSACLVEHAPARGEGGLGGPYESAGALTARPYLGEGRLSRGWDSWGALLHAWDMCAFDAGPGTPDAPARGPGRGPASGGIGSRDALEDTAVVAARLLAALRPKADSAEQPALWLHAPGLPAASHAAAWNEAIAELNWEERPILAGAPPAVEIGPSLRAKAASDAAYGRFVDAVVEACGSPEAARLGVTRYTMEESRDRESVDWLATTLTVWFSRRDLDARLAAWTEIRSIVDSRTAPLRNSPDRGAIDGISSRLFIVVGR